MTEVFRGRSSADGGAGAARPAVRRLEELTRAESLRLLAGVSLGRVVFSHRALPAIRPVNHVVEEGRIIFRTDLGTAVSQAVTGQGSTVVAYEADVIGPADHLGWTVIVVGQASRLTDEREIARYQQTLDPWVTGGMDDFIAIDTDLVSGFRLVDAMTAAAG